MGPSGVPEITDEGVARADPELAVLSAMAHGAQGRTEGIESGRLQGRVDLVMRQLNVRFGALSEEVKARIATSSLSELDAIGERLLTAQTLQEALG